MGPDRPSHGPHSDATIAANPVSESQRPARPAPPRPSTEGQPANPGPLEPSDAPALPERASVTGPGHAAGRGRERRGALRSGPAFVREASALRRSSERGRAMLWSRHVNRPIGAWIAYALLPTRVTPNMVSVAGTFLHLVGALLVVVAPVPVPPAVALAAFVSWELALALDNADGLLARARNAASPFGAWFDQILDFVNHTAVIAVLVAVAAQALPLTGPQAGVLGVLALSGNLLLLFASAQRNALLGTRPALGEDQMVRLRPLLALRNLTDYGAFLAAASLGLLWPPLLIAALIVSSGLSAALVAVQVAINWPRG